MEVRVNGGEWLGMTDALGEGVPFVTLKPPNDCERLYSPAIAANFGVAMAWWQIPVSTVYDGWIVREVRQGM